MKHAGLFTLGAAPFAMLVIVNAGGYRYGVSDWFAPLLERTGVSPHLAWAARQPVGTNLLADPVHAARYGASVPDVYQVGRFHLYTLAHADR